MTAKPPFKMFTVIMLNTKTHSKRKRMPRKTKFIGKQRLVIRPKKRPLGQTTYNIEIGLCSILAPEVNWRNAESNTMVEEVNACLETIRNVIGSGYKIIKTGPRRGQLHYKVLLVREEDVFLLVLTHSTAIKRAYKYI